MYGRVEARLRQGGSVMRGGRYERSPILEEKGMGRKIPARNETPTGRERRDSKSALALVLSVTAPLGRYAFAGARSRVRTKCVVSRSLTRRPGTTASSRRVNSLVNRASTTTG